MQPGRQHRRRPPSAADFLEEFHVQYPQRADPNNALLDQLRIPGLPVTLILGSDAPSSGSTSGRLKEPNSNSCFPGS